MAQDMPSLENLNSFSSPPGFPFKASDLFESAEEGDFEFVTYVVTVNPRLPGLGDSIGKCKTTLLHLAAFEGHADTCRALCAAGVDKDARDYLGATALHVAAIKGHLKCVEVLIFDGASIVPNNRNRTPLHEAAYYGHADVLDVIILAALLDDMIDFASKEKRTALHDAVLHPNRRLVFSLLEAGANINELDDKHWTPLDWAERMAFLSGDLSIVNELKAEGAVFGKYITANS